MALRQIKNTEQVRGDVLAMPGVDVHLSAEQALRAAIDTQIFSALRELEPLDGGRAVQSVYVALIRRLPNVIPSRERLAIDTGFSESSVKRAIKLLELCKLMTVERAKGRSSAYQLADIRRPEEASRCLSAIRGLVRATAKNATPQGRATSEPTVRPSRVTSEPGSRVRGEPEVGSQVAHKGSKKIQFKQQGVAAFEKPDEEKELDGVLRHWGLASAKYLVTPGHNRTITALAENPKRAAMLIDRTMRLAPWSATAGVGAKVEFLRANVDATRKCLDAEERARVERQERDRQRATRIAASIAGEIQRSLQSVDPENELLLRGLDRLGETREVAEHLAGNKDVRHRIVSMELLREETKREVESMSDDAFQSACENLFEANPGLRRFFVPASRESIGLRLKLIEHRFAECQARRSKGGEKGGGGSLEPAA